MSEGSGRSTGGVGCFGLGSFLAAVISAALNHSFWWGVLHFFCGWFYLLYAALVRSKEVVPALREMFGLATSAEAILFSAVTVALKSMFGG